MDRSLAVLGLGLVVVSVFCVSAGFEGPRRRTREAVPLAAWVAATPASTVASLREVADGERVLLEARVGAGGQTAEGALVVYDRLGLQYDRRNNRVWRKESRRTVALALDAPDGPVSVVNDTYEMERPPTTRMDPSGRWRYDGFAPGDPLVVIGRVVRLPDGVAVRAERITGGDRAGLVAETRRVADQSDAPDLCVAAFGAWVGLMGVASLWKARRV